MWVDEKGEAGGLHVVNIEFPPSPPRYSRLRSSWFGRQQPLQLPPPVPSVPAFRAAEAAAGVPAQQEQQTSITTTRNSQLPTTNNNAAEQAHSGSDSEGQEDDQKTVFLDRRWLGWTWRRWAFVLGPCLAIVVMAVVLVAVFVSRLSNGADGGSNPSNTTQPASATTSGAGAAASSTGVVVPAAPVTSSASGAFNGSSIAAADPGNSKDLLWAFYQDVNGDLCYIAQQSSDSTFDAPLRLSAPTGVLNGTALTAISWNMGSTTHINLIYQEASGSLRNFLYDNNSNEFKTGFLQKPKYNIALPTDLSTVKRMSWSSDDQFYHYLYFPGADGQLHEYIYNIAKNNWSAGTNFTSSNGYAGSSTWYDSASSTSTLALINSAGQIQLYYRPYNVSSLSSTVAAPKWTAGASTSASTLGFTLNTNSSLAFVSTSNGPSILAQDATSDSLWTVPIQGSGASQAFSPGVNTDQNAIRDSSIYVQPLDKDKDKLSTYAFVQQSGNDVTMLQRGSDGVFRELMHLPIG